MNDYYEIGPNGIAHYWYDRDIRSWMIAKRELPKQGEKYGDQIGSADYAPNRNVAQQYAREMVQ